MTVPRDIYTIQIACHRLSYKLTRLPLMDNGPTALRYTLERRGLHRGMTTALHGDRAGSLEERLCKSNNVKRVALQRRQYTLKLPTLSLLHRSHDYSPYTKSIFGHSPSVRVSFLTSNSCQRKTLQSHVS